MLRLAERAETRRSIVTKYGDRTCGTSEAINDNDEATSENSYLAISATYWQVCRNAFKFWRDHCSAESRPVPFLVLIRDNQVEAGTDSVLCCVSENGFCGTISVKYHAVNGYDDDGLLCIAFCVGISYVGHGLTIEHG